MSIIQNPELVYRIAFSALKGLNLALGRSLLALVGSEQAFFEADESFLRTLLLGNSAILSRTYRDSVLEAARREADFIAVNNITPLYFTDSAYPRRLLECEDAPMMLYSIGSCNLNATHTVGIVGTRHATPYGMNFVNGLVAELSRQIDDVVIVSGLAYGIDITAHRASLANNVPTVAVFAHGLSTVYPGVHRHDAATIVKKGGSVITDYFHDAPIHKGNFLARNRIVAGLCDAIVVVESAEKGGSLITAKIAAGYNRDVFALPGRTSDTYSKGCNRLISKNVAALIQSPDDLIDEMGWYRKIADGGQTQLSFEFTSDQQAVIDYLTEKGEGRINEISIALNFPVHRLLPTLVDLEFKGAIINFPGGLYRRS